VTVHDRRVEVTGPVAPGFEPVREVFADVVREQRGTGAAVAAWYDGRWVVDLVGGFADAARTRPWTADSIAMPYSVSKPFAALPALVLVDRGVLDLDAPMQRWWPEFAAPATLRQVLSHSSGIVGIDEPAPTELFYDWNAACARLAAQEPVWPPGAAHGECALFYGHLVGEPVHRVDGRSVGALLRDEVTGPLGIDVGFGLSPVQQQRAVDVTELEAFVRQRAASMPELYRRATENPLGAFDAAVVNGAPWRAAEIPAINAFGTARGMAQMYVDLVAGRILSAPLVAEMTTARSSGPDRVFGHDVSWGLGVAVDDDGFGMGGSGGHFAGWSAVGGYALGFVTGTMGSHERVDRIDGALREVIGA
jgi:CubicO group peptidase (beta-lactamase class C family)